MATDLNRLDEGLETPEVDPQAILPGSTVTGSEWNGEEWHFHGQGGEDVCFELTAENVQGVFGLTLSPLNVEGSSPPWQRSQYANAGETVCFHAVLPETGEYRIGLYFGLAPR